MRRATSRSGFALEDFDLVARHDADDARRCRVHKGRLFTDDAFDSIHIEKVHVEAGQSRAMFDGKVDLSHEDHRPRGSRATSPTSTSGCRRFDLPAFVTSAGGGSVIIIKGKLTNPKINVNTELAGVPCLDRLRLDRHAVLGRRSLEIRKMTSQGLGGELTGSGRVRIPDGGGTPFVERLYCRGAGSRPRKLCGLAAR